MPRRARLKLESLCERITPVAGQLDPTFGTGGIVAAAFGPGDDKSLSVLTDSSGRILVGGSGFNGSNHDFVITRYLSNGTLDPTFGAGGIAKADFAGRDDFIFRIALDSSNRIVASGFSTTGGNADNALARFNTDGTLDGTFGIGGKVLTPIGGGDDFCYALAIDSVGRIVVGGGSFNGSTHDLTVCRYTPNGSLDPAFDGDGILVVPIGPSDDAVYSLAIDSSDRIVTGDQVYDGAHWRFAVVRFNVDGSFDTSFNGNGIVLTPIASHAYIYDVKIDESGRIVAAGNSYDGTRDSFTVARYNPNGSLDTTFNGNGIAIVQNGIGSYGFNVLIDSEARVVVCGNTSNGTGYDFAVLRLNPDGTPDADFGTNGIVTTAISPNFERANCSTIDDQGRIVVTGYSYNGTNFDWATARYSSEGFSVTPSAGGSTFSEDSSPLTIDSALALTNSPNANLAGAIVHIANFARNEDVLGYTLQGGISGSFDSLTGTLTLSNSAPLADYQAVLRSLTYSNTSHQPIELDRTVTITVDDGEATQNLASASYTIHVVAVNDAPSFAADGVLFAILQANTTSLGQKIAGLFAWHFADPDTGSALSGIAAVGNTANAVSEGRWQYSSDNGTTWFDIGTMADDATALALAASTRIRFVPVLSYTGQPTPLAVRALDNTFAGEFTSGAVRQTVDVTINGGSTPIAGAATPIRTTVFPIGTAGNNAPVLSGVPVSANIDEGQALSFTASAFDPDLAPVLTFSLDSAPAAATIDPDTGVFAWLTTEDDGPDTFIFNVQVSDGLATTTKTITVLVREVNTAPTLAEVPATANIVRGDTLSFTASATDDDDLNGNGNALTFSLVGAPAGASIDPDSGDFTWTPTDAIPPGDYAFTVRVVDDGVPAKSDTQSISVTLSNSLLDNGDLLIGGTTGNDTVTVNPAHDPTKVTVKLNGVKLGDFDLAAITGSIIVRTGAGADKVTISSKITEPALLDGGPGNDALTGGAGDDTILGGSGDDKLTGGKGNNVLVGGDGNDTQTGGGGRDVLIGGKGKDKLLGGSGDDLLIAGFTDFDTDVSVLNDIFLEWNSGADYPTRIAHLTSGGGANGTSYLTTSTVHDDGIKDALTGASGTDWFFVSALDTLDLKTGEQKVTV